MQAQLALLLLCSTCVLCSDVSQDQQGLEEELFGGLLAAQTKQKQSAPYRPTSLLTLCRLLSNRRQDASSADEEAAVVEEEEGEEVRALMEESLHLLEEAYSLQHICGALQGREERQLLQESLEYLEENINSPLKRKSPYILKRQSGRPSKSRRPYILKRSAIY